MRDGPGRCGGRLRESGLSGSVASRGCREVDGPRWCHSSGVSRLCGAASLLSGGVVPLARRVQCAWRATWYRVGHLVGARIGVPNARSGKNWLIRQNGERSMNQAVSSCRHSRFESECDSNAFRYRLLLLTQVLTATSTHWV